MKIRSMPIKKVERPSLLGILNKAPAKPRVLNKYHGNIPANAKYIGRGSPYGNPFVIGKDGTREEVIERFDKEILPTLDVEALRGHDLVCFCKPKACHGDAIMRKLYCSEV